MSNSKPLSLMNGSYHLRYTPPTCTLEVVAKQSPLSRWTNRPVLKHLQFELSLDDPRVPEEKQAVIRGDRSQLDILYYAVSRYVQNLLQQSPAQLDTALVSASGAIAGANLPEANGSLYSNIYNLSASPASPSSKLVPPPPPPRQSGAIYLQPRGLVSHRLFLGSLATPESGEAIDLGALQLFDLATALDEYAAEVMVLPPLPKERSRNWQQPLLWAGAGAAATLVAVGVTATFIQMRAPSEVATTSGAIETSDAASQETLPLPLPPEGPPPPLTQPQVQPSPTPTPSPLAEELDTPPIEEENRLLPPPPVNPTPIPIPSDTEVPEASESDRTSQSIFIPGDIIADSNSEAAAAPPEPPAVEPIPTAPDTASIPKAPPLGNLTPPALPPSPSLSSEVDGFSFKEDTVVSTPLPSLSESQAADSLSRRPDATRGATEGDRVPLAQEARELSTAFDVVPQIAELRGYFQDRWEPLPGLTRDLEYTLILNEDGSLQQAIPLGHAADNYLDRTGVPLEGEPMVSSFAPGQTPQMRVVLEADGGVKAFLESLN